VAKLGTNYLVELPDVGSHLVKHRPHDTATFLAQQSGEELNRLDLWIAGVSGQLLRASDRLLGFDCEFVETEGHRYLSAFSHQPNIPAINFLADG
jgi:hypothetical protein